MDQTTAQKINNPNETLVNKIIEKLPLECVFLAKILRQRKHSHEELSYFFVQLTTEYRYYCDTVKPTLQDKIAHLDVMYLKATN